MILSYRIAAEQLMESGTDAADVLVYRQPTDAEKEDLKRLFALDPFDLEAVYDPDEVSRVESSQDGVFMIWKRPDNVSSGESIQFEVSSLGIVIRQNQAAFIVPRGELALTGREFKRIGAIWDCVLHVLLHTVHHYQGHLKGIKMMSQQLQAKIVSSMENRYLVQMFALGESLVYYHNALESNLTVLSKLRGLSDKLKFTAGQINFLDDVIIENQQASKQASIYSTVLSGLMDARGTIINNNMNVLLKNLTVINVVFLPLNLIAGIFGMSEYSMITQRLDWRAAYGIFLLATVALGWVTWWWLVKVIDRNQSRRGGKTR
jgi:magnesium transporter